MRRTLAPQMRNNAGYAACSFTLLFLVLHLGCSKDDPSSSSDGLGGAGGRGECVEDFECDDGAFCNGRERCDDGACSPGSPPSCDDGVDCTTDSCDHSINSCVFVAPDVDQDGHRDQDCRDSSGARLGDDCDDEDGNRHPGNLEVCDVDEPNHDEDCNPETFGQRDVDEDGFVSRICRNRDEDSDLVYRGLDCDDDNFARNPDYPEICDGIDNDCDDEVDVDTVRVFWYPDADGDQYGEEGSEGTKQCAPIPGHALRNTDCDDGEAAVHPGAREVCDGLDNDCDGNRDEGGVCDCSPEGNTRACVCTDQGAGGQDQATGSQSCVQGLWSTCDCTQCFSGTRDCLGGIWPRACEAGRYVLETPCAGARSVCEAGECVCPGQDPDCEDVQDIIPPALVASAPYQGQTIAPDAPMALVFSEAIAPASIQQGAITLKDFFGNEFSFTHQVGQQTIVLTLDESLPEGREFALNVGTSIADFAGNQLEGLQELTFWTERQPPQPPLQVPGITLSEIALFAAPVTGPTLVAFGAGGSVLSGLHRIPWDSQNDAWDTSSAVLVTDAGGSATSIGENGDSLTVWMEGTTVYRRDSTGGSLAAAEAVATDADPAGELLAAVGGGAAGLSYMKNGDRFLVGPDWMGNPAEDTVTCTSSRHTLTVNPAGRLLFVCVGQSGGDSIIHLELPLGLQNWFQLVDPAAPIAECCAVTHVGASALLAWTQLEDSMNLRPAGVYVTGQWEPVVVPPASGVLGPVPLLGADASKVVHLLTWQTATLDAYLSQDKVAYDFIGSPSPSNVDAAPLDARLAVSPGGRAIVAWTQPRPQRTEVDLMVSVYEPTDGAWSAATRVNDPEFAPTLYDVSLDSDDRLWLVYLTDGLYTEIF